MDLSNSFSNSFIDFYSCEVVSWSDVRKNEVLRPRHTMRQIAATRCRDRLLQQIASCDHREHTLLLNRKRVNKGMKRRNSSPLSPVVLTRPYYRENRYLQDMMVPFYQYQWRQPACAQAPLHLPHVFFDTTKLSKILPQLSILNAESR